MSALKWPHLWTRINQWVAASIDTDRIGALERVDEEVDRIIAAAVNDIEIERDDLKEKVEHLEQRGQVDQLGEAFNRIAKVIEDRWAAKDQPRGDYYHCSKCETLEREIEAYRVSVVEETSKLKIELREVGKENVTLRQRVKDDCVEANTDLTTERDMLSQRVAQLELKLSDEMASGKSWRESFEKLTEANDTKKRIELSEQVTRQAATISDLQTKVEGWKSEYEMVVRVVRRSFDDRLIRKTHLIDSIALTCEHFFNQAARSEAMRVRKDKAEEMYEKLMAWAKRAVALSWSGMSGSPEKDALLKDADALGIEKYDG